MIYEKNDNDICFYINRNKLINNFKEYSKIGTVFYPLKSNSNKEVLNILKPYIESTDNGFLISYIGHYNILKSLDINPKNMCLMNVLLNYNTIKTLYDEGIKFFTIDNIDLLKEIFKFIELDDLKINIRLSINDVFPNVFSHLGANTKECLEMIDYLKNKCTNVGLSFYLNADCKSNKNYFERMIEYVIQNFKNSNLKFITIGGVEPFYNINKNIINNMKKELNLNEIILEPGQNLVGNVIDMETEIIKTKIINDKKIVIIKNGIYSGFFDKLLYNKNFDFYFKSKKHGQVKISYKKTQDKNCEFYMYGGSSDSGDKLGKMFIEKKYINEFTQGAKFYVKNIGSYFEEFFMPYGYDLIKKYIEI